MDCKAGTDLSRFLYGIYTQEDEVGVRAQQLHVFNLNHLSLSF